MVEDASLDDFLSDESGDGGESDAAPSDDGGATEEGDAVPPTDVDPADTTSAWAPDGTACESCGAVVDRRWRDDGALVCPDCKDW